MLDLHLTSTPEGSDAVTAGYSCPCGCRPATTYRRGEGVATEGCCCGNEFAVGPEAGTHVHARAGYEIRNASLTTSWGEVLLVAWAIGPSTHDAPEHDEASGGHHDPDGAASEAIDPVCGMTVATESARTKGLHVQHLGVDYFFCGKGCTLDFGDEPQRCLDPSYVTSM